MNIYANKLMLITRFVIAGFPALLFGSAMILSFIPAVSIIGIFLISLLCLLFIRHIRYPQIQIENNQLTFINTFGILRKLGTLSNIDITINKYDILFRLDNDNEYSLGSQFLTKKEWLAIANQLSNYKFRSCTKCL